MPTHIWIVFIAALVPLLTGFIWYHPKVFGKKWTVLADMTEEKMKSVNMGLIFAVTYLLSVLLAFGLMSTVVHQIHVMSLLGSRPDSQDPNSEASIMLKKIFDLFGNSYRTFKHGTLHGTIAAILVALPVLGINALFERKSFKYITIHLGYWILTFALMGGIICQWL